MKRIRHRSTRIASILAAMSDEELARDGFATVDEACDFLTIGRSKLYELLKEGELVGGLIDSARCISRRAMVILGASILERRDRSAA